jgi:hypothetical protein
LRIHNALKLRVIDLAGAVCLHEICCCVAKKRRRGRLGMVAQDSNDIQKNHRFEIVV